MSNTLSSKLLSVRLTPAERETIRVRAGGRTLSGYVKSVLFEGVTTPTRTGSYTLADRTLLAQLLATLGGSHLAPNLERLAREADIGNLFADEDTAQRLREACDDVRLMHNALMRSLGKKEKTASRHEVEAAAAFNKSAQPRNEQ